MQNDTSGALQIIINMEGWIYFKPYITDLSYRRLKTLYSLFQTDFKFLFFMNGRVCLRGQSCYQLKVDNSTSRCSVA